MEVPELTLDEREIEPVFESEAAGSERIISDIVRREIEILRETLKKEIAELRNRIEG